MNVYGVPFVIKGKVILKIVWSFKNNPAFYEIPWAQELYKSWPLSLGKAKLPAGN